jgi:hypothetical protein
VRVKTQESNSASTQGTIEGLPLTQVEQYLHGFASWLLEHPAVRWSSESLRRYLHRTLSQCMVVHIDHEEDNRRFVAQQNHPPSQEDWTYELAQQTYYDCVRGVSAEGIQSLRCLFDSAACWLRPESHSSSMRIRIIF